MNPVYMHTMADKKVKTEKQWPQKNTIVYFSAIMTDQEASLRGHCVKETSFYETQKRLRGGITVHALLR